jgi:hypothetical protein
MQSITTTIWESITTAIREQGAMVRQTLETGSGIPLHPIAASYPIGSAWDAITAGTVQPESVTLTSDGRHYDVRGWHEGPEAGSVYVERWTPAGRTFHGWIDSRSRRLVQAG